MAWVAKLRFIFQESTIPLFTFEIFKAGLGGNNFQFGEFGCGLGMGGRGAGCTALIGALGLLPSIGLLVCKFCLAMACCCLTGYSWFPCIINCCPCCLGPEDLTMLVGVCLAGGGVGLGGGGVGVLSSSDRSTTSITGLGVLLLLGVGVFV